MSKYLNVMECIGTPSAITQELGDLVFEKICVAIEEKEIIEVDFADIESMISPFLNNAIGKLYGKYSSEEIGAYLKFQNIPAGKVATINMVINNAKKFYANQSEFEKLKKDVLD